jgi:hypothetical protein
MKDLKVLAQFSGLASIRDLRTLRVRTVQGKTRLGTVKEQVDTAPMREAVDDGVDAQCAGFVRLSDRPQPLA